MAELFDEFPRFTDGVITIRKITEADVYDLEMITGNENVYKFIPPFLYKKSRGNLLTAIKNLGGRDFEKKKMIIAGIYLRGEAERLVGLAEMFDFKKKQSKITVGYRLNEDFWHKGIATRALKLMREYLSDELGITSLMAFVMSENENSAGVLLKNDFVKENYTVEEHNWGGIENVMLDVYKYEKK